MININEKTKFTRSHLTITNLMWLSTILIFFLLMLRGGGIFPVVFADEWAYSSYTRLHNVRDVGVPSYLYFALFKITNICGDGFLECARVLNALFIAMSLPVIFALANRFCSSWQALIVAVLSVIGPINTYAIYFMPESMYFFGFWLMTWFIFKRSAHTIAGYALILGVMLGLLSLVKIHAIFLLPSFVLYVVFKVWRVGESNWYKVGATAALGTVLSFSLTKLAVGFMFAGQAGLNIFGSLYSSHAQSLGQQKSILEIIFGAVTNFSGHIMALVLMFGLPIAVILNSSLRNGSDNTHIYKRQQEDLIVYAVLVIAPLLLISSYFTASVAGSGPYENIGRLHMRYYNFALPLFYLIAVTQLKIKRDFSRGSLVIALFVTLVACLGFWHLMQSFAPSMVDSPELRGFTRHIDFYRLFVFAGIATTIVWAYYPRKSAMFFLFILLPTIILFGSWTITKEVRSRQVSDEYDEAGQFAKRYLGLSTSRLAVVAPSTAGLLRILFHIDNLKTQIIELENGSSIDIKKLPTSIDWLLLIGDYEVPGSEGRKFTLGKHTLLPVMSTYSIDFKQASWPGILIHTKGLSKPEAWGTWSIGSEVNLEFLGSLPKKFRLSLDANAFLSDTNENFKIVIGTEEHNFDLKTDPQTVSFEFSLPTNERIIRIIVPNPTSPKSIGLSDDTRLLGIGLRNLLINQVN